MKLDLSTFLPSTPEEVERYVRKPGVFAYVSAPFVRFKPCDNQPLPETWAEGTYWVSLWLFGLIPLGKQAIVVSFPAAADGFCLHDNGYSALIKRWDHVITIGSSGSGTLYRDQVSIDAGIFTFIVWGFAQLFFRHRQRRWRKLVAGAYKAVK